eukprot:scpid67629/ scgid21002/ 
MATFGTASMTMISSLQSSGSASGGLPSTSSYSALSPPCASTSLNCGWRRPSGESFLCQQGQQEQQHPQHALAHPTSPPARFSNPPPLSHASLDQSPIATSPLSSHGSSLSRSLPRPLEYREQPREQPQPAHQHRHQQQRQRRPSWTSMDPSQAMVGPFASGGNSAAALTQYTNDIGGSGSMSTPYGFAESRMAGMQLQQQQPQQSHLPSATTGSSLYQSQYGNTPPASSASGPSGTAVYADSSSPYYRPGNGPVQHGHTPHSGSSVKAPSGHQSSMFGDGMLPGMGATGALYSGGTAQSYPGGTGMAQMGAA